MVLLAIEQRQAGPHASHVEQPERTNLGQFLPERGNLYQVSVVSSTAVSFSRLYAFGDVDMIHKTPTRKK
jgi:hypothetical protein